MLWTTQGYAGLPKWRERIEEGERIIAEAGGKIVGVYVTLGRYDVVEIFAKGGHGFGLRPSGHPVSSWPTLVENWLKEIGVL